MKGENPRLTAAGRKTGALLWVATRSTVRTVLIVPFTMAWFATEFEASGHDGAPEITSYIKLFPPEWVSRHPAPSYSIRVYRLPYPSSLENLRRPRSADLGDVCVTFVRSILVYQGIRPPAVDLASKEDLVEIEKYPPQIEIPLVTDGWIPRARVGFNHFIELNSNWNSPTSVAVVTHNAQLIKYRTNLGTFAIFLTPHGVEANEAGETPTQDRLKRAAGLVGAVLGKLPIYEELFSIEVNPDGSPIYAASCVFENPAYFRVPDLSASRLELLELMTGRLSALPHDARDRAELSLNWFYDAINDPGVMAFLKYWIAIETLAMPDGTNIAPLKHRMAVAYSCSEAQANARFALGKLANLRGEIVHKGRTVTMGQDLLWLIEAIYVDLLAQILGVTARMAEGALKRSGRTAEELTSAAVPVSPRRLRLTIKDAQNTPAR